MNVLSLFAIQHEKLLLSSDISTENSHKHEHDFAIAIKLESFR